MISLTNYDFQWARSELVTIYPDSSWHPSAVPTSLRCQAKVKPPMFCVTSKLPGNKKHDVHTVHMGKGEMMDVEHMEDIELEDDIWEYMR